MRRTTPLALAIALGFLASTDPAKPLWAQWKPVPGPLTTKWAKDVTAEKAHPEYPRPQLVRENWTNLNGLWDYAISDEKDKAPGEYAGKILVPFPVESSLSGVMKRVSPEQTLWYRRGVQKPKMAAGERLLLHFCAVDWHARVVVNGKSVGEHRGGYDPFSFDITDAIGANGKFELAVAVTDPSDTSYQPRGKQVVKPGGIFYTPITGIWQTVWLEVVPATYVARVLPTPNVDAKKVSIQTEVVGDADAEVMISVLDGKKVVARGQGKADKAVEIAIDSPKLWAPGSPNLYDLEITVVRKGQPVDQVKSYFAMRKISLGKDAKGLTRVMLNNQFVFQSGLLDQGFWPDGLYTAPTDAALKYDLEITQKLGFNMVRKHVKTEPATWYRHCDEMGLIVWQDMPSGDRAIGASDPDIKRSPESAKNYENEWKEIVHDFEFFPSIVMWVPFNEGWGQFDTARIVDFTRKLDPTRLVNNASGWSDRKVGDVNDAHIYPGPGAPEAEEKRAIVLGEFGGLGLPLESHTWQAKDNWGYRSYKDKAELNLAFAALYDRMPELIAAGLSASVYTQTTDVEVEVNGILTYDREILKIDADVAKRAHAGLKKRIVRIDDLVATSEKEGKSWRYTTDKPDGEWAKAGFDDSKWREGEGGFGERTTPNSVVRTEWKTDDIWLRRSVEIPAGKHNHLMLRAHWDEDTEVYFNGKLAAKMSGYSTQYGRVSLTKEGEAAIASGGPITIAIHTHQTGGGQYIDIGLVDVIEEEAKE